MENSFASGADVARAEVVLCSHMASAQRWRGVLGALRGPREWPDDLGAFVVKLGGALVTDVRRAAQEAFEAHAAPHGTSWSARHAMDRIVADVEAEAALALVRWNLSAGLDDARRANVMVPRLAQHVAAMLDYETRTEEIRSQLRSLRDDASRAALEAAFTTLPPLPLSRPLPQSETSPPGDGLP